MAERYVRRVPPGVAKTSQKETAEVLLEKTRTARLSPRDMYGRAPFGLPTLDSLTGGFGESWLVTLAGRPGCGKSALAMQFAEAAATYFKENSLPYWVKVAALEMTPEECLDRRACARAGVSSIRRKSGRLLESEMRKYENALSALAELPIEYVSCSGTYAEFEQFVQSGHPCGLWVLDHVGLLSDVSQNANNAVGEIKVVANRLKALAKDRRFPGMIICHTNRKAEENKSHRAMLGNLGYADEIGKNSDLVLSIYRPDMYAQVAEDLYDEPKMCWIDILKHRHGGAKNIKCIWYPDTTEFLEMNQQQVTPIESVMPPGIRLLMGGAGGQ